MATAETRVPQAAALAALPAALREAVEAHADRLDIPLIGKAFAFGANAHAGQRRASGEAYTAHLVEVARIVDGVTKIGKVQFQSTTEQQVENYRKLLLSMAQDARVIVIKLADRLHNMRTLEHLRPDKRKRIALETREIYAPLAHRLGMARIRWELEDLAFKHLEPEEYKKLAAKIAGRRAERETDIEALRAPLEDELRRAGIPCEVYGRPKHLWSIHRKITQRGRPYEEIYDLMAIRVVTDSVGSCYHALGVIHNKWTPMQERFHDYIATPKSNMYRSLHTTIFGPRGRLYEIQIRTHDMHRTAEYGIAAHWRYKEGEARSTDEVDERLSWFRQVLEWQQDTREPEEFMEFLRIDLFHDEIFVFTPKGDVKQLPRGATPIDFAFAVHTEVGYHCSGARINGRISPLSRALNNGDTVEVMTDARHKPSRDWLAFVKTARARQKIRQWIKQEESSSSVTLGRELFQRELRKLRKGQPSDEHLGKAAEALHHPDFDSVLAALGRGELGPAAIFRELFPGEPTEPVRPPTAFERFVDRVRGTGKGVRIQGLDNMMVRYSQCCQPVPGDQVIGYITRGRGISIHRTDCPNVLNLSANPERRVEIDWAAEEDERFLVRLVVEGSDRRGLLSDVASAISGTGTNIQSAEMRAVEGGMTGAFVVEVHDLTHLKKVIKAVRRVNGVLAVERKEHVPEPEPEG